MNISVIIPAYNVEKYIERSLNSVLNQKLLPYEIIVVDDGSTDQTSNIVRQFNERVVYIYQENEGSSSARNLGIKKAKGDWIAFLDSDDEWVDTHLLNFEKTLRLYPNLEWYGAPFKVLDEATKKELFKVKKGHLNKIEPHIMFKDYMNAFPPKAYFSSPTMIIKKSIFEKVGVFELNKKTGEDLDMWFRIGLKFPNIGYTHKEGAIVYRRELSLTTSTEWNPAQSINRFKECELLAKETSFRNIKRVQPRIVYWVNRLIRSAVAKGDIKTLKEVESNFGSILSVKYRLLLRMVIKFPFLLKILQLKNNH